MSNPFIGEIRLFAGNFAPNGWFLCQGQQLVISEFEVLFNLIGTTYGGNGTTVFNLPNLASRVPVHQGQAAGGSVFVLGQLGGSEQVTLTANQVGAHGHPLACTAAAGTSNSPANAFLGSANAALYTGGSSGGSMAGQTVAPSVGGLPHNNLPPYLAVNFIIAWAGIFPSQG